MSALQLLDMELLVRLIEDDGGARERWSMRSLSAVIFGVPAWPLVDLSSFCTVALFPDVFVTSTESLEVCFVPSPIM